jgi:hypothetical protein
MITINNRLFNTHTHACEFMTSKSSWHTKNMACHVIITWNIELILIAKDNFLKNYLINEINSSKNDMNHDVK